ncbi:MAG TPA: hypothetical protein VIL20_28755 [Sandaracinaceae bacterium]
MARDARCDVRWPVWALACALACGAAPARAWTEAAVRSVAVRVHVSPDASAHVTLTATVRVHGGWLEGIDLAGLDPDLVLDETAPPFALDAEGRRYRPRAEVLSGGRVQLAFGRRDAPRRGTVTITLAYRTSLAHRATEAIEGGTVRVRWTLPGWRSGLDGVQIEMLVPPGARPGPAGEGEGAAVATEVEPRPEGTLLRFRRAHLPRTLEWSVAADVPADAMAEELRAPPVLEAPPPPRAASPAAPIDLAPYWTALAALLALLACAKMAAVARLARASRAIPRPLLPLPALVRAPLAVALALGGWLAQREPLLASGLLAMASLTATYRTASRAEASSLGAWRPADAAWIRAARRLRWTRWIAPSSLLDATTPLGLAHLAAWVAVPWLAPLPFAMAVCAAVLPLPILTTGTRLAFPTGPAGALAALLAVARRMRSLPRGAGLRPVLHVSARGEVQDARVRTVLERRPRGLLRLDLVLVEAAHAGGYERGVRLLVATREGSAAEKAAAEKLADLPAIASPGGRRIVRIAAIEELERAVAAFAECPEAPVASRGTSTPNETIRALPAPRAVGL